MRHVPVPAAFCIEIKNETRRRVPVSRLKKLTEHILRKLKWKRAALSLLLVNDPKIQKINRRFLKHDRPTDVIAFGHSEKNKRESAKPGEPPFLGDIVISLETTARQAKIYGNSFFYELVFYICHGILHIMGHNDHSRKDAARMHRKQHQILKQIGL